MVMELLEGGALWDRFVADGVSSDAACAIGLAVASALEAAHGKGVLHRDLKPENVLFTSAGVPKLADFGIAKVMGGGERRTMAGQVIGTPAYMSPEQALGRELGPGTDVYSLAVVLYELLSGELPYSTAEPVGLLTKVAMEPPRPLCDLVELPAAVETVVMTALAKEPEQRPPTAEAFGVALAEAATAGYGAGWLGRSQVPFQGGGRIADAARSASSSTVLASRATIGRPSDATPHARLGGSASPPAPTVTPGDTSASPPTSPAPSSLGGRPGRRLALLAAGAAMFVLIAAVAVVRLAGDGGSAEAAVVDGVPVLADGDGRTTYVTVDDRLGVSSCLDVCAQTWPPVTDAADLGLEPDRLTTISRSDGSPQLAVDGRPIYRFEQDDPGEASGQGVSGAWFALAADGAPIMPLVHLGYSTEGVVLKGTDGFTLYTFADDPSGESSCVGPCLETWPAVAADTLLDPSLDAGQFSAVVRPEGDEQLAWNGRPLYRYVNDDTREDAKGVAVGNGTWSIVPAPDVAPAG
jgi:predicted lipoprotein with Yx(FWY)xxD motif